MIRTSLYSKQLWLVWDPWEIGKSDAAKGSKEDTYGQVTVFSGRQRKAFGVRRCKRPEIRAWKKLPAALSCLLGRRRVVSLICAALCVSS